MVAVGRTVQCAMTNIKGEEARGFYDHSLTPFSFDLTVRIIRTCCWGGGGAEKCRKSAGQCGGGGGAVWARGGE